MSVFNQVQRDDAWVLKMAAAEEGVSIEVGGLQGRLDTLKAEASQHSLVQFIELSRRQLGLSSAQLAEKARVSVADLLAIETGNGTAVAPDTVVRIAAFLGVDPQPLLCLAGLSASEDEKLEEVAAQFTARLEAVAPLELREREALEWFKAEALKPRAATVKVG